MKAACGPIPPGPVEKYSTTQDLLRWMGDQFERFGDIFKASVYGASVYASRDPQHARHVLRQNCQNYVKGQAIKRIAFLLGNGLMVSEGEFWKTQRRMIQPAFHRTAIDALANVITASNVALLARWENAAHKGASVNVTRDVSGMVLEVVLLSIFGADYKQVAPHFNIVSEESARNLEFAQSFRSLEKVILELAARRRQEKTTATDILGMLMDARDQKSGQAMSDRQLVNEIKTLIVAGHETTANTLSWSWYLLSQNPKAEEKLASEINNLAGSKFPGLDDLPKFAYTRQVIDEVLRLYPAGWLLTRRALKDDQLGVYFVPAGTEIYVSPYFIQRHPDLWEEHDRFNPDRFDPENSRESNPLAMIPFSTGPRNCIGENLARVEMQIHLMTIAGRIRFRPVESNPPELDVGVNLRSKHDFIMNPELKAEFESRGPSSALAK
ncbi:MAG: cytochrome P450 [Terriglobales bacterium]